MPLNPMCGATDRCARQPYWQMTPYGRKARNDHHYSCRLHFSIMCESLITQYRVPIMVRRTSNAG